MLQNCNGNYDTSWPQANKCLKSKKGLCKDPYVYGMHQPALVQGCPWAKIFTYDFQ